MISRSSFTLSDNSQLLSDAVLDDRGLVVRLVLSEFKTSGPVVVHWGVSSNEHPGLWVAPTEELPELCHFCWTEDTKMVSGAAQTAFQEGPLPTQKFVSFVFQGVTPKTPLNEVPATVEFVIHVPPNRWIKHGKQNFMVPISSFLRSVLSEKELLDASKALLEPRLSRTPKHLLNVERWNVENRDTTFTLVGYALAEHPASVTVYFLTDTPHPLLLHWGLQSPTGLEWERPDVTQLLPRDPDNCTDTEFVSHPWDNRSLRTEFQFFHKSGTSAVQYLRLVLRASLAMPALKFVLKELHANTWFKRNNADFVMPLPQNPEHLRLRELYEADQQRRVQEEKKLLETRASLWTAAQQAFLAGRPRRKEAASLIFKAITLSDGIGNIDVSANFNETTSAIEVCLLACARVPLILHWGVVGQAGELRRLGGQEWQCPPKSYRPDNTVVVDAQRACETKFSPASTSIAVGSTPEEENVANSFLQEIQINIPAKFEAPKSEADSGVVPDVGGITFVLREESRGRWFKSDDGTDIVVRLTSLAVSSWQGDHAEVVEEILNAEVGWHQMTLMHRCNLVSSCISRWHSDQKVSSSPVTKVMRSWTAVFRPSVQRDVTESLGTEVPPKELGSPNERDHEATAEEIEKNKGFWAWIFVWCRFSYIGLLDWQRNYNTKPKDLAHATECLTYKLADLWIRWPEYRPLTRLVLSTVTRGGNQGQAIRDRILDIMHRHKIPEHAANFYEQWHQKLHNNTTPDDIPICQGVIAFLRSGGNVEEFWKVLKYVCLYVPTPVRRSHGIEKARLESYERKIVAQPYMPSCDIGSLIHDFEQYLDILKDVHDALDLKVQSVESYNTCLLQKAFEHAARFLPHDAADLVRKVVHQTKVSGVALKRDIGAKALSLSAAEAHMRFEMVAEARRRVIYALTRTNITGDAVRELLFLDFALEQQLSLCLQGEHVDFTTIQMAKQLTEMVVNLSGHHPVDDNLHAIATDLVAMADACAQGHFSSSRVESALMLKALADRVALYVGGLVNEWQSLFGPRAQYLGQQLGIDQKILNVFVDEVLRGSVLFGMSATLKRLEGPLRAAAKLPPWQIISLVPDVQGRLVRVEQLINIQVRISFVSHRSPFQDKVFAEPTILLSGAVSGEEEIPAGVQAVLVRSAAESPDILSHVSVRARNGHVLLAVCFDFEVAARFDEYLDSWVQLTVPPNESVVNIARIRSPNLDLLQRKNSRHLVQGFNRQRTQSELFQDMELRGRKAATMDLTTTSRAWVVTPEEFDRTCVGSKSLNLQLLRPLAPEEIVIPHAVALPYGSFQKTLVSPENVACSALEKLSKCMARLKPDTPNEEAAVIFEEAQKLVRNLEFPAEAKHALREKLREGPNQDGVLQHLYENYGDQAAWQAICSVWASLFGLRPWVTFETQAQADVFVELLPARFAFVLHTKNPFDPEAADEMYGELVLGLGETLVGNTPGRALSWKMKRHASPTIVSFPSKSFALRGSACLIFRSDSNGEDLEGFAGAGLFESTCTEPNAKVVLTYASSQLIQDRDARNTLLARIGELAFIVQDAFGGPMDIEGVVLENNVLGIVQARPQV